VSAKRRNIASPERQQTDHSLRSERKETDRALAERQALIEGNADDIVVRARENADAVLTAARDKVDETQGAPGGAVAKQRAIADETLRGERAVADESLRLEREENRVALSRLLPLERETTDRYLLSERVRSDEAVSNRDDFLGIASHDLRSLLAGVVLTAARLSKRSKENEADAGRIQIYAARMNRLVSDLVDVASIDAGQLHMSPAAADASTVVRDAVETFQARAAERDISLQAVGLPDTLPAEVDQERLLQVLANLLANAIKFTPAGGSITVRAEGDDSTLRFSVTDTGGGIPDTMLESVFERFWQVGKNDTRGIGLGLYISRCIVAAHGGKIWVESRLGHGSVFHFTIPRRAQRPSAIG
jgi:signal transduction histidine kinase